MAKVLIAGIGGGKNKKKGEYDPTVEQSVPLVR